MGEDDSPSSDRDEERRRQEGGRGSDRGEGRRFDRRGGDRRGRGRGDRRDGPPVRGDRRGGGGRGDRFDRDRGGGGDRGDRGDRGGGRRGDGPPRNVRNYHGPREGFERRPGGRGGGGGGERVLVLPGEEIPGSKGLRPGAGTYREDGRIVASVMGLVSPRPPFMRVIALAGRYIPQRDDLVVGVVQSVGPTYWLLDIRAPHFCPLHMTGTPWQMDYGETGEYLRAGETVMVRVEGIDDARRIGVSMNGPGLGKLEGGYIYEISPTKVPRVIGKSGSMIQLIQQYTGAHLVVGQNGRVWIDGDEEQIRQVRNVLELIERESQRMGLTDRVKELLERQRHGGREDRDRGPAPPEVDDLDPDPVEPHPAEEALYQRPPERRNGQP